MAESYIQAFGRYLRTLRERLGLSLDGVCSLSQTFPEKLNKGYLSRCENGHQKLAFSKVIALSRIYEVPSDVLVERIELDMELDRLGVPETDGKTFTELTHAGKSQIDRGFSWAAYGYLREAYDRSRVDPVGPSFRDHDEQQGVAQMNCASAGRNLGKLRFALHELLNLEPRDVLTGKHAAVLLERISACYRAQEEFERALEYADRSIALGESLTDRRYLGYSYGNRARVATSLGDEQTAVDYFKRAHAAFSSENLQPECAISLNNLSQCYFNLKKYRSARAASEAALKIAERSELLRIAGLSLIMQGEIDRVENRGESAEVKWRRVVGIAKETQDKELRFKGEFLLWKFASGSGREAIARAIRRRLEKLSPSISPHLVELREFRQLTGRSS